MKINAKRARLAILTCLLLLSGCSITPAWEQLPEVENAELPQPTSVPHTSAPRFDMLEYIDGELGGGHSIEGKTLRLERDIVLQNPVYLYDCDDLTIDLNGHSIRYDAPSSKIKGDTDLWIFVFDGGKASLISSGGNGKIFTNASGHAALVTVMGHATLHIDGIDFQGTNKSEAITGFGGACVYVTDGSYAQISGGTFAGDCGIFVEDPEQTGTTVIINGGEFGSPASTFGAYFKDTATIVLNKGSFSGTLCDIYAEGNPVVSVFNAAFATVGDAQNSGWRPRSEGMEPMQAPQTNEALPNDEEDEAAQE